MEHYYMNVRILVKRLIDAVLLGVPVTAANRLWGDEKKAITFCQGNSGGVQVEFITDLGKDILHGPRFFPGHIAPVMQDAVHRTGRDTGQLRYFFNFDALCHSLEFTYHGQIS